MKTAIDERFRSEAQRYHLQFACPHCAYFDEPKGSCSEGYPVHEHVNPSFEQRSHILFCKLFEAT